MDGKNALASKPSMLPSINTLIHYNETGHV